MKLLKCLALALFAPALVSSSFGAEALTWSVNRLVFQQPEVQACRPMPTDFPVNFKFVCNGGILTLTLPAATGTFTLTEQQAKELGDLMSPEHFPTH